MEAQPTRPTIRALIVDDNRDAADSLASLLALVGYEARVAYDGLEGLRIAAEYAPDCLVLDVKMPGLDGYAFARTIRDRPAFAATKLIALSAFSDDWHIRRAAEAGFDLILTKPADPLKLLEAFKMIEQLKEIAAKTQILALQNVDLAGQAKELLREVKDDVKEVKKEVRELKKDVEQLKNERAENRDPGQ